MKSISRLLVGGLATSIMFAASFAQADIRDAGAKARGEYGAPFISNEYRPNTTWYVPTRTAGSSSAAVNNDRSYSYDSAMRRSASPSRTQTARQPASGARRFSYEPNTTAAPVRSLQRGPAANIPSNRGSGVRDAASKILGQY